MKIKLSLLLGLVSSALMLQAQISTQFTANPTDSNLRNTGGLTLVYTIDGSGVVNLDATSGNANADVTATADGWDGNAGTVTNSALFNTTHTLVGAASGSSGGYLAILNTQDGLGIQTFGNNRIDGSGTEAITWTYTTTATGVTLDMAGLGFSNRAATADSKWLLSDSDTSVLTNIKNPDGTFPGAAGTIGLSGAGYSLSSGQSFTVASYSVFDQFGRPNNDNVGATLTSIEFELNAAAIPEPSSYAIIGGLMAIATVLLRRRRA
jgi:hypothetical protein